MNKRAIFVLGIVALILLSFSLVAAQRSVVSPKWELTPIPADKIVPVAPPAVTGERDYCFLNYCNWQPGFYYPEWRPGDKLAVYFDPDDCGFSQNYPFQLTDVHLMMVEHVPVGSVSVRFSVEVLCPDLCDGPGIEIWKSQTYQITTFYPDMAEIYFADTVCLDKPFFFNVEYVSDYPSGYAPSFVFEDPNVTGWPDTCYQWQWFDGVGWWVEWYDFFGSYGLGWIVLGISGSVADQADCGEWYWKPDTLPQAPSGMPDFDQNQRDWVAFCGPTAVANCLSWFNAVPDGMTPPDFIELLAEYFSTTSSGTYVDSIQAGLERYFEDYGFALSESTFWMPDFYEMEDSLKRCQDIILLLGFWWWDDNTGGWYREGGHFVTMAGVNSEKKEIAISDPDRDQCVRYGWWPGRVRPPEHPPWPEYSPYLHNDPGYVSHDVYVSLLYPEFPSPGSDIWDLADYCYGQNFPAMNVPHRFEAYSRPAPKQYEYFHTEVEAAVMICPLPNNPPYEPSNPSPPDGAVNQSVNVDLSWTGGDPDPGNTVTYDVYLGNSSPPPLVTPDHPSTSYDPGTLAYGTQYYWQIVARDPQGAETSGPVWDFTTEQPGWHWKDAYDDYAPNGMPDIDQRQDDWVKSETPWQYTFCGPVAVANCFKWFDSRYNDPPGFPGDSEDQFPLVRQYIDGVGGMISPYDDHDPWNVDHMATPWHPGIGLPPPTPQPFVPGPQPPGMPRWGELVERLAWFFDTDGIQGPYCNHTGTNIMQMQQGIQDWFDSEEFPDGSTLADTLCEVTTQMPTFAYVESLIHKCEDVILLLGFWFEDPQGSGSWFRIGGHYVTVAGVNSETFEIAFSDPFIDFAEIGWPGRVGDGWIIPHPHGYHDPITHNDEGNVSHDIYGVDLNSESPGGVWWIPDYAIMSGGDPWWWSENFFSQNIPDEFLEATRPWSGVSPIYTEVEYCVHISPWDYRGDANQTGSVEAGDVVFLISYLFRSGPAPDPYLVGDANCDGTVTGGDIVRLIGYLFRGEPVARCCDP